MTFLHLTHNNKKTLNTINHTVTPHYLINLIIL